MFGKNHSELQKQKIKEKLLENNPSRGTFWWNNGKIQIRSKDRPGDDFYKGRLNMKKDNKGRFVK